ncbi:MAG: FadR/GntR family transcriptional regulator [Porticoccaceae bacterium]
MSRVNFLASEIGGKIAGGVYPPGTTLPIEQEMSETYSVGRNVVREAIKVLVGKGFLRTERRAGTIVQPRQTWAMTDPDVISWMLRNPDLRQELLGHLTQLRGIIEPEAAALAAENASIIETLRLFEAYEDMKKHRHDRDLAIAADIRFHERLLESSHNPLLGSMAHSIKALLRVNFEISIESPDGFIRNLEQHGKVAEAIHRHDPVAARLEMQTLLSNNTKDLENVLEESHRHRGQD